ncbi:MAG: Ig-like domain-containing protein, partial [Clostridia bacterium]|nr:Ig-like domain-containing protein [Clostridia bacterium]
MKKRWFIVLAALIALIVAVSAAAETSGTCGDSLTWTLSDSGTLIISGTGPMADYSEQEPAPWGTQVKEAHIRCGVTGVGSYAFSGNAELTSVVMSNGVTRVGEGAFKDCAALPEVVLPTGTEGIEPDTFNGCAALKTVIVPNGANRIGKRAIMGCVSLSAMTKKDITTTDEDSEHTLENPVFEWAEDYSECSVKLTCRDCSAEKSIPAAVTCEVVTEPTTETKGLCMYTATVEIDGVACTEQKEAVLDEVPERDREIILAVKGKNGTDTATMDGTKYAVVAQYAVDAGCTKVTFKSSKKKVATIDSVTGELTLKAAGKTTITATAIQEIPKGKKIKKKKITASISLTVIDPSIPVSISVAQENPAEEGKVYIGKDDGCQLAVTAVSAVEGAVAENTVTWKSSKTKILKVDKHTGLLKPVKAGTAKITATSTRNKKAKSTITVTVVDLTVPAGIKITTAETTVQVGSPLKLDFELLRQEQDVEAKSAVTWKTSNKKIAKVSKDGTVTGLKYGTVTITATT